MQSNAAQNLWYEGLRWRSFEGPAPRPCPKDMIIDLKVFIHNRWYTLLGIKAEPDEGEEWIATCGTQFQAYTLPENEVASNDYWPEFYKAWRPHNPKQDQKAMPRNINAGLDISTPITDPALLRRLYEAARPGRSK